MASENKNENVMLTGQTAYFKKSGSMVNRGVIHIENTNTTHSYAEGFVDEGSKIDGHNLEYTTEYKQCVTEMQLYMEDLYDDETTEGYAIVNNCNRIKELLLPGETYVQNLLDSRDIHTVMSRFTSREGCDFEDLELTLPVNFKVTLDIRFSKIGYESEYELLTSTDGALRLYKTADNKLMINDVDVGLYPSSHNRLSIVNKNGKLSIQKRNTDLITDLDGFTTPITVNMLKGFIGLVYSVKIFDLDVTDLEYETMLQPMYNNNTKEAGLFNTSTMKMYVDKNNNLQYTPFTYLYGTNYCDFDTGLIPNDLDLGFDIGFGNYSTGNNYGWLFSTGSSSTYGYGGIYHRYYPSSTSTTANYFRYWHDGTMLYNYETYIDNQNNNSIKYNINKKITINDTTVVQDNLVPSFEPDVTIKILGGNTAHQFRGRMYYFKIYNNTTGELLRDFIPVRDHANVVCLWDNITKKLYYRMYPQYNYTYVSGEVYE